MGRTKKNISPDYLIKTVRLDRELTGPERELLTCLNSHLPRDDLYFEEQDGELCCYLNSLNPEKFTDTLDTLSDKLNITAYYQETGLQNPFFLMKDLILGIGSYGIRYKKTNICELCR